MFTVLWFVVVFVAFVLLCCWLFWLLLCFMVALRFDWDFGVAIACVGLCFLFVLCLRYLGCWVGLLLDVGLTLF